jgi:hypothetical protein
MDHQDKEERQAAEPIERGDVANHGIGMGRGTTRCMAFHNDLIGHLCHGKFPYKTDHMLQPA